MKPGLAILPLEVWADIFLSPWFTRQELAQLANGLRDRQFVEKLQKLLHDCGKPTLRYLNIFLNKCGEPQNRACLKVASYAHGPTTDCEFPETQMPENINSFKKLTIRCLDDDVLDFLHKIKPLFTNVHLDIIELSAKVRTVLAHLFPMLGGIRTIEYDDDDIQTLEQHFPGTLARAKELITDAGQASIPTLLNWLNAPLDFAVHGPRFVKCEAKPETITALIAAVRQQFLAATTPSAFVIFLEHHHYDHHRAEERTDPNNINEQLSVRNALFQAPMAMFARPIHYVEIMRHPIGAEANMREWVKQRAYFEQWVKRRNTAKDDGAEQMISIDSPKIGHISDHYKASALDQAEDESTAAGRSSTSAAAK